MKSFQTRMLLFFLPFFFLFSLAMSLYCTFTIQSSLHDKIIEKGISVAETLSHACELGVLTKDAILLEWATREISKNEKILMTVVYDTAGNILYEKKLPGLKSKFPLGKNLIGNPSFKRVFFQESRTEKGASYFDFTAPVHQIIFRGNPGVESPKSDHIIGYIRLAFSSRELGEEQNRFILQALLIELVFLLSGVCIIFFFSRKLTRPIKNLTDCVSRFAVGDWREAAIESEDEIGSLAKSFNIMARRLKQTAEKNRNHQETLEQNLRERTEKLRESETRYRKSLEASPDPVVIYDMEGHVTYINPAFTTVFEWTETELLGKKTDFVPEENQPETQMMIRKVIEGKSFLNIETRRYTKSGKILDVVISGAVYRNRKGVPLGSIINIRDITEEKKLKNSLQQAKKMEAIGTLAGGVAHDLNNILSGILSYPDLLLMKIPEESDLKKPLLTIKKSGEKAAAIVQDLLTLARRSAIAMNTVNMNDIVLAYVQSPEFRKLLSEHPEISVETDFAEDLLNMFGSTVHLQKTVMNLVTNAAEAMPLGGVIRIRTKNIYEDSHSGAEGELGQGEYVSLKIIDTGIGIAKDEIERIFEPFYSKKKMGRSGTGLGMAVVWGTVMDHEGIIDVESELNKGTTFSLLFPATRKAVKLEEATNTILKYGGNGEKILVVDDFPEQREIASSILTSLRYKSYSVESGEQALEFIKKTSVDLILLDMVMEPGMDGLDTFKQIKKIHPKQKAIIASGFSETRRVKEAQLLGVYEYIRKPYTIQKIGQAIQRTLRNFET